MKAPKDFGPPEPALYVGRRYSEGKLYSEFKVGRKTLQFAPRKFTQIGHYYEIFKDESGEPGRMYKIPEEFDGKQPIEDTDKLIEWETLDQMALAKDRKRLRAVKLKNKPRIFESMHSLQLAYSKAGFFERWELVKALHEHLETNATKVTKA